MQLVLVLIIIFIIFEIPTCFGMGLIFKKMNLDPKKGMIPFYNKMILINKYKLPSYHITLIFIPVIGLYTNYCMYSKICKEYNKDKLYVLELTLFPFIFNIFLGLELKQEGIDNSEEKKDLNEKEIKDEYIWYPKQKEKSDTIYKASRNNLNAKVNITIQKNNEIIDNKRQIIKKEKTNTKICPKCGTKVPETSEICFVCGTKL